MPDQYNKGQENQQPNISPEQLAELLQQSGIEIPSSIQGQTHIESLSPEETGQLAPDDTVGMQQQTWVERIEEQRANEPNSWVEYEQQRRGQEAGQAIDGPETAQEAATGPSITSDRESYPEQEPTSGQHAVQGSGYAPVPQAATSGREAIEDNRQDLDTFNQWLDQAEQTFSQLEQDFTPQQPEATELAGPMAEANENEIEQPGQSSPEEEYPLSQDTEPIPPTLQASNDNEYQPTEQDWEEYGQYLDEQAAQRAGYSNEMTDILDQYAARGNDDPEQTQDLEQSR